MSEDILTLNKETKNCPRCNERSIDIYTEWKTHKWPALCWECHEKRMARFECDKAGHLADDQIAEKADGTAVFICYHCDAQWEVES